MSRIRYRDIEFNTERQALIVRANRIIDEYGGARLSARQIYYRFIADAALPDSWADAEYNRREGLPPDTKNTVKNYSRLASLLVDARYAGLIDWDAIEDRNREPLSARDWPTGHAAVVEATDAFRLDRWRGQHFYVELWVEKAALAGVLGPIADDYHVVLMVNRGYSSASAMRESAERIRGRVAGVGPRPVVLYVGDHDPSGEDMVRDVRARLVEFGCPDWLDVRKLALTTEQVEEHHPPPNPAKVTDSRAAKYIERHGEHSWEVDALPPRALDALVRRTLNTYIDKPVMDLVITEENKIKARLRQLATQVL